MASPSAPVHCSGLQGDEGEGEGAEEEGGVEGWKTLPCELCGRTYPHEHVKAVYREHNESEDEVSDS